jgi:hypothetical protein
VSEAATAALGGDVVEVKVEHLAGGPLRECENVQVEPVGAYEKDQEDCEVENARGDAHEGDAALQQPATQPARPGINTAGPEEKS